MTSASLLPSAPANAAGKLVDTGTEVAIRRPRSRAAVLTLGVTPRGAESCTLSPSEGGPEVLGDEGGRKILAGLRSLGIFRSFCGIWKGRCRVGMAQFRVHSRPRTARLPCSVLNYFA